jgi:hypothetical protein
MMLPIITFDLNKLVKGIRDIEKGMKYDGW